MNLFMFAELLLQNYHNQNTCFRFHLDPTSQQKNLNTRRNRTTNALPMDQGCTWMFERLADVQARGIC